MGRILGAIVPGPGDQDKVTKENAKQIAKQIKAQNFNGYFIRNLIVHLLPIVHLGVIASCMMTFVEIPMSPFAFSKSFELLHTVYFESYPDRTDFAATRFPRKTVYVANIHGPSGTFEIKDILCFHSTASVLEITFCLLLVCVLMVFVIMIFDKLIMGVFFAFYIHFGQPQRINKNHLRCFDYFAIYLIQKNVSPNLMVAIWLELRKGMKRDSVPRVDLENAKA